MMCCGDLQTIAMDMLKSKLLVIAQQQKLAEVNEIRGDMAKADFGQADPQLCISPLQARQRCANF